MMEIKQLCKDAHEIAKSKGFHDNKRNVGELLMLCVSELSEALEADRCNVTANCEISDYDTFSPENYESWFRRHVKDSFEDEIADTFIRLADLCELFDIDIESHIKAKLQYNKTRERLHGKRY